MTGNERWKLTSGHLKDFRPRMKSKSKGREMKNSHLVEWHNKSQFRRVSYTMTRRYSQIETKEAMHELREDIYT